MKTTFRSSFLKDFKAVRDKQLVARLRQAIEQVEKAQSLSSLPQVKQLKGGTITEFELVNIVLR